MLIVQSLLQHLKKQNEEAGQFYLNRFILISVGSVLNTELSEVIHVEEKFLPTLGGFSNTSRNCDFGAAS